VALAERVIRSVAKVDRRPRRVIQFGFYVKGGQA
jgi:hypothetical protein